MDRHVGYPHGIGIVKPVISERGILEAYPDLKPRCGTDPQK